MLEIQKELKDDVNLIVDALVKYENKSNLSWLKVYYEILDNLDFGDRKKESLLLSNTVSELTNRGYDINDEPFNLVKYK